MKISNQWVKKKRYASMQQELAARKAAAGYIEEPRARISGAEEAGSGWSLRGLQGRAGKPEGTGLKQTAEGKRPVGKALRIGIVIALALAAVGLAVGMLIPDGMNSGQEGPFDQYTEDEEIVEYIDERWSIDKQDYRKKIALLSWVYGEGGMLGLEDIGSWGLDASENFVILRTECPEDMNEETFFRNCEAAAALLQRRLQEDGMSGPSAVIAREPLTGDLMLVLINGAEYYRMEQFR